MTGSGCGRCGGADGQHSYVEGDCTLPHRNHSTRLIDGAYVCEHCVTRWDEWLAEIVDLYAGLSAVLFAGSIPDNTAEHKRPKKAPASPSPIRLDAWALLHPGQLNSRVQDGFNDDGTVKWAACYLGANLPDIPAVLTAWAEAVYESQSWGAAPDTVTGAVAACRANAEVIARLPEMDDFDAELRWIRRALRSAHGLTSPSPICPCIEVGCGGHVWPKPGAQPSCNRCRRKYGPLDLVRAKVNDAVA